MHSSKVVNDLIPVAVRVDEHFMEVRFNKGLEITTPVSLFPRLAEAAPASRERWQLNGRGYGIPWPDVDEDITVSGLIRLATSTTPADLPEVA